MVKRVLLGMALLAGAVALLSSCGTVESGNVGVRTTLGKVNPHEVEHEVITANMQTAQLISFGK